MKLPSGKSPRVLVIDVGGTNVKMLARAKSLENIIWPYMTPAGWSPSQKVVRTEVIGYP